MRIAQLAPPHIPIPPPGYGGSEIVVSTLTEELVRRGHEVTLFAHPDSHTGARLVSFPETYGVKSFDNEELVHTARALEQVSDFDVVHNHCLASGPALGGLIDPPSLTTLHYIHPILRSFPEHPCVAVSAAQASAIDDLNILGYVHNAVACRDFPLVEHKSDYLLFLGRMDEKKGPDLAIEVARRLGAPLLLAAPLPSQDKREYFETKVVPQLDDDIRYIGEATGREKIDLLAHARCLISPVRWEEPFGMVAVEAMVCGTPVVATRRGALPEVVPHGEAGFVVDSIDAMVDAVRRIDAIEPARCRQVVEERFSAERMADGYLAIYQRLLAETKSPSTAPVARERAF